MFDLQKFADEVQDDQKYDDILDSNEEYDDSVEEERIPPELEGIPNDIAREIMSKANQNAEEQPKDSEEEKDTQDVKIPYSRFKEVSDQKNETEKLLAEYRARYGDLNAESPQSPPPQKQQALLNAELTKQIDEAVNQRAMQISGLSKEDVDSMDYYEDSDPRIKIWKHAQRLAEADVYNGIIQNQIAQQQAFQRNELLRSQSMNSYNDFVTKQQASNDFNAIQQFAENEFFMSQPDTKKQVIYNSYANIRSGSASPADVMIVQNFFENAERAFYSQQGSPKPQEGNSKPKNFPRTNKVNGTTGSGGGITEAELTSMIRNKPWGTIPPQYQRLALGI